MPAFSVQVQEVVYRTVVVVAEDRASAKVYALDQCEKECVECDTWSGSVVAVKDIGPDTTRKR